MYNQILEWCNECSVSFYIRDFSKPIEIYYGCCEGELPDDPDPEEITGIYEKICDEWKLYLNSFFTCTTPA